MRVYRNGFVAAGGRGEPERPGPRLTLAFHLALLCRTSRRCSVGRTYRRGRRTQCHERSVSLRRSGYFRPAADPATASTERVMSCRGAAKGHCSSCRSLSSGQGLALGSQPRQTTMALQTQRISRSELLLRPLPCFRMVARDNGNDRNGSDEIANAVIRRSRGQDRRARSATDPDFSPSSAVVARAEPDVGRSSGDPLGFVPRWAICR